MEHFRERGVIEGFYGPPWSAADRLWMIEKLGRWGMNRYVYAPKDDPLQRARWRDPYPDERLREFRDLIVVGQGAGVDVGFAISPGGSMVYGSREDREALWMKMQTFAELGSRLFVLALDDIPSRLMQEEDRRDFATLADAHVTLAHALQERLGPETTLCLVPTDYLGVESTAYLETLGQQLDSRIEIAWTGRTVVSPRVTVEEARQRAAVLQRKPLLWDNVPVADGPLRSMLHLGPYRGRDAGLPQQLCGVWLNPMPQAHASAIPLRTAARYLEDPETYEEGAAWEAALDELAIGGRDAFGLFARAHRFSALALEDRDTQLEAGLVRLRASFQEGLDAKPVLGELRQQLGPRLEAAQAIRTQLVDKKLVAEIEPWLDSYRRETRRMERAVELLQTLSGSGPKSEKMFAFFRFEGGLVSLPPPAMVSFGPRRVLYPQLRSMEDETMALGPDPALLRGRCLADEFVALAEARALAVLAIAC